MSFLKVLLLIADPLLLAFVSSALLGACLKNTSYILALKRIVSLAVFGIYFIVYIYFVFVVGDTAAYIAMFAPFAGIVVFIAAALIAAPKDSVKEQSKKDFKMTGWDTMFPNDIDNK